MESARRGRRNKIERRGRSEGGEPARRVEGRRKCAAGACGILKKAKQGNFEPEKVEHERQNAVHVQLKL